MAFSQGKQHQGQVEKVLLSQDPGRRPHLQVSHVQGALIKTVWCHEQVKESPREESVPGWWKQSSFITPRLEGKRGEPYVDQKERDCPAWKELPDVSKTQGAGGWPAPGVTGRIKAHLTLFPLLLAFIIGQSQLEARWQGNPLTDSFKWPSEAKRRVESGSGWVSWTPPV